jgi:threonylcarbamoyladenosine tRNA methylthiotransferase MtaB
MVNKWAIQHGADTPTAMKIKIANLGCRLNQSEIQSVATVLIERGHEIDPKVKPDIVVINACSVTLASERKTRKLLSQATRELDKTKGRIIITGCTRGIETDNDRIMIVSNDHKHLIPDIIEDWRKYKSLSGKNASRFSYTAPTRALTTRVNLKIQDGCDNYCSYCIIPIMRGAPQSKPFEDVVREFSDLLASGYKEIVISGVMIGKYSHGGKSLESLLVKLISIPGDFRVHLSSMSPATVTDGIIDMLSEAKIVRHLHLSLQSGSDSVLSRMNRRYTAAEYIGLADKIRKRDGLFNFTTDVIVGFPGETDREFYETISAIKTVGFSHIHTFRYSPRPGTAANKLMDNVPESVKRKRSQDVIRLYMIQKRGYYSMFNERETRFLSERHKNGTTSGFNEYYVPVSVFREMPRNVFYNIKTHFDPKRMMLAGFPADSAENHL